MAIRVEGMDDAIRKLAKLSDQARVEEIAKHAVSAAEPLVVESTRSALAASETGPRSTGSASASVSGTGAKVNEYGVYAVARPTGRDSKGVRNGMKAALLEYGVPGKLNARPWRAKAAKSAEESAKSVMENIVKTEMECE